MDETSEIEGRAKMTMALARYALALAGQRLAGWRSGRDSEAEDRRELPSRARWLALGAVRRIIPDGRGPAQAQLLGFDPGACMRAPERIWTFRNRGASSRRDHWFAPEREAELARALKQARAAADAGDLAALDLAASDLGAFDFGASDALTPAAPPAQIIRYVPASARPAHPSPQRRFLSTSRPRLDLSRALGEPAPGRSALDQRRASAPRGTE